ncbi:MAG TPA: multiheme c-type cytochrome, partial [Pyrinomonadaceae bacterium]|nr:multiheme c-type cytochrome [Pyrinomonadaceae bacterium]
MRLARTIKTLTVLASVLAVALWLTGTKSSQASGRSGNDDKPAANEYVGSETCAACHEDVAKAYSHTPHAALSKLGSWKNKVTGCESCHGPGKAHVDGNGDKTKIVTFTNKSSKEISDTCLTCHAGRDERSNFRRGEHWRNDIGCTDCHSPHATISGRNVASS